MARDAQVRAAEKRVNRFIAEHGDQLLTLPKALQTEILEDVWQGNGNIARLKLRTYAKQSAEKRSETSKRAAQTVLRRRQIEASQRILRAYGNLAHRTRTMKNAQLWTREQLAHMRTIQSDSDLRTYVSSHASAAGKAKLPASPFYYR